jgi:hypothetical protein
VKRILFESQFNNNPKNICRIFAESRNQAKEEFKKLYLGQTITTIYEP